MIKVVHYPYHFLNQQSKSKVSSYIKYKFRGGTELRRLRVGGGYVSLLLCENGGPVCVNSVIVCRIFVSDVLDLALSDICRF